MKSRVFFFVLALVMGAIGLIAALALDGVREMAADLEQTKSDNAKINASLNEQEAASLALAEQVKRLGGKPVVDPPAATPAPPVPPAQGRPAPRVTDAQVLAAIKVVCAGEQSLCIPTQAQVKVALTAICAGGACDGRNGRDAETPEDGQDATDAQIDAAVARHCAAGGCRGPGPTDAQVDDRLAAYCSVGDNCRGERGEKGDSVKGDTGEPGSVTPGDYTCPDGEWITAIHVAEGGTMTVDCSPLIGRGD